MCSVVLCVFRLNTLTVLVCLIRGPSLPLGVTSSPALVCNAACPRKPFLCSLLHM